MSLIYDSEFYYKFYFWATGENGSLVTTKSLSMKHGQNIMDGIRMYMTLGGCGDYASRAVAVTVMKQPKNGDGLVTSETYQINREFAGPNEK